jgi:hypothetical protein
MQLRSQPLPNARATRASRGRVRSAGTSSLPDRQSARDVLRLLESGDGNQPQMKGLVSELIESNSIATTDLAAESLGNVMQGTWEVSATPGMMPTLRMRGPCDMWGLKESWLRGHTPCAGVPRPPHRGDELCNGHQVLANPLQPRGQRAAQQREANAQACGALVHAA